MDINKPKVIKDFERLDQEIQEQIKLAYPTGFRRFLIEYRDKNGYKVSALPFETEEKYYLVRMTQTKAQELIREDDDYDEYGNLKAEIKEEYEDKYGDEDDDTDSDSDISNIEEYLGDEEE